MADYFTNFSVILPLNKEQQEYGLDLVARIQAYREENSPFPDTFPSELVEVAEDWCFEVEGGADGLWLHAQYGGQEAACTFIQHLLQKFEFEAYVTFEWSHDCNKPLPDAFGGGAAYITSSEIETFTTSEWLQKMTC